MPTLQKDLQDQQRFDWPSRESAPGETRAYGRPGLWGWYPRIYYALCDNVTASSSAKRGCQSGKRNPGYVCLSVSRLSIIYDLFLFLSLEQLLPAES